MNSTQTTPAPVAGHTDIDTAGPNPNAENANRIDPLSVMKRTAACVSWIDVAAGLAVGVGVGYLLFSRRSPETLASIYSDSLLPWASRNVDRAKHGILGSRPVAGVEQVIQNIGRRVA